MRGVDGRCDSISINNSNNNLSFIIIIIIIIIIIGFKKYFGHSPGFPNRVESSPVQSWFYSMPCQAPLTLSSAPTALFLRATTSADSYNAHASSR